MSRRGESPDKISPQALEAERSVLGAVLIDPTVMDRLGPIIRHDDFYKRPHRLIYRAMQALHSAGEDIDLVTLSARLETDGSLDGIGGPSYLSGLMAAVPTAVNAEHYARIVARRALARRTTEAAGKIAAVAYEEQDDPDGLLERVTSITHDLVNSSPTPSMVFSPAELAEEFAAHVEQARRDPDASGLPTGFPDVDRLLRLRRQELTIIAARPSTGKTALAEVIAEQAAADGRFVVFASLEMSRVQLLARRAARKIGGVSAARFLAGEVPAPDEDPVFWRHFSEVLKQVGDSGMWLIDNPRSTTASLRADVSRARMRAGKQPDLVVIDYLQLLKDQQDKDSDNSRIEFISGQVKALAREFNVPVLCLSQLSRKVEERGRDDRVPRLHDLRGSGAIEQDADTVIFLHRAEEQVGGGRENLTTVRIAKQRNGPIGDVHLTFVPAEVTFRSYYGADDPNAAL